MHILGLPVWVVVAAAAAAWAVVFLGPHIVGRADRGGQARKGHVVWVEPLRFPGWPWGRYAVARALRAAGFEGTFEYYAWQTWWQGLLIFPVLWGRSMIRRQARRLADLIVRQRAACPEAPLYLIAYSGGAYVAVRALELLPAGLTVRSAALCQAAMTARYDLTEAMRHVQGPLVVTVSALDFTLLGAGTGIFGGTDGWHGPSMGWLGPRHPALRRADERAFRRICWRPALIRDGLFGMHLWAMAPRFISKFLCPAMGIGTPGKEILSTNYTDFTKGTRKKEGGPGENS
jgi:hypothetical protein